MTDILVNWLNNEVVISKQVAPLTFAKDFCSGFLVGEVLSKHGLQDDFESFSLSTTNDSKLNNFSRLEPTLHLLGIPFDTNVARDIMSEHQGVATRLMYQLFIALSNKQKAGLTGVAMETMRPAGPATMHRLGYKDYKDKLHKIVTRESKRQENEIGTEYNEKKIAVEKWAFKERLAEEAKRRDVIESRRQERLGVTREIKENQQELLAKIDAACIEIPRTPPSKTLRAIDEKKRAKLQNERGRALQHIDDFEGKLKILAQSDLERDTELLDHVIKPRIPIDLRTTEILRTFAPENNSPYVNKIKRRLAEDSEARAEREKRRRKVLIDQLKASEAREEARREEVLLTRLLRQSQQERRIAAQLLAARHEKAAIREHRLFREQQYQERRREELAESLNREAELGALEREKYADEIARQNQETLRLSQERKAIQSEKNENLCADTVSDMVDFASKICDYREMMGGLVPRKLWREWSQLFVEGQQLFDKEAELSADLSVANEILPNEVLLKAAQDALDEQDWEDYQQLVGDWQPITDEELAAATLRPPTQAPTGVNPSKPGTPRIPSKPGTPKPPSAQVASKAPAEQSTEQASEMGPMETNVVLEHVVTRLLKLAYPPTVDNTKPLQPPFPIRAALLGKSFAGKTKTLEKLTEYHNIQVIDPLILVDEAVEAYTEKEQAPPTPTPTPPPETAQTEGMTRDNTTADLRPDNMVGDPASNMMPVTQTAPIEQTVSTMMDTMQSDATSQEQTVNKTSRVPSAMSADAAVSPSELDPLQGLSVRAKLGYQVAARIKTGRAVEDALLCDLVAEAVHRLSPDSGFILDGFPTTYAQTKMLEKALGGVYEPEGAEKEKLDREAALQKSVLLNGAATSMFNPAKLDTNKSSLDVVVLLDVSDDEILRRATGRLQNLSGTQFHQESRPDGTVTGVNRAEILREKQDPAGQQVMERLAAFSVEWPKMEKWFKKYSEVMPVPATFNLGELPVEVSRQLDEKLEAMRLAALTPEPVEPEPEPELIVPPPEPEPEPVPEVTTEPPPNDAKKPSSAKGGKGGKGKKGAKTPEPEPELPTEPAGPAPGDGDWVWTDQEITNELLDILAPQWRQLEEGYLYAVKQVLRNLRLEREQVVRYLYQVKDDFNNQLISPDHKQQFVTDLQMDINNIDPHLRKDPEVKQELHQRLDDLRERLWSISDQRKADAETSRDKVVSNGWMETHVAVILNTLVTLMQGEADRMRDTVLLLKDYYRGQEGMIPDEYQHSQIKIPVFVVPDEPKPNDSAAPSDDEGASPNASRPTSKARKKRADREKMSTPAPTEPIVPVVMDNGEEPQIVILPRVPQDLTPTVPVMPTSGSTEEKGKGKGKKGSAKGAKDKKGTKGAAAQPNIQEQRKVMPPTELPEDLDERLLTDAWWTGFSAGHNIVTIEMVLRDQEKTADSEMREARNKERSEAAAAGSKEKASKGKGKARSPSPKKGRSPSPKSKSTLETTSSEPDFETPEERESRLLKERQRRELTEALLAEETRYTRRIKLIKQRGIELIRKLRRQFGTTIADMTNYLGERFLKEMAGVDQLSEVVRVCVEEGTVLTTELLLDNELFACVDDGQAAVDLAAEAEAQSRPATRMDLSASPADQFTVAQLCELLTQFESTAPEGFIEMRCFEDLMKDLTQSNTFPPQWNHLAPIQLTELTSQFIADGEYVDWRLFLLVLSQPWPIPSQGELIDTLHMLKDMDQKDTATVTREQWMRTELWFGPEISKSHFDTKPSLASDRSRPRSASEIWEPPPPNYRPAITNTRIQDIQNFFFDLFSQVPNRAFERRMDYVNTLLYFARVSEPHESFLRALSVAAGQHMPRIKTDDLPMADEPELTPWQQVTKADLLAYDIPADAEETCGVSQGALFLVLRHGSRTGNDSRRFKDEMDAEDKEVWDKLTAIFEETNCLGERMPFRVLAAQPVIMELVESLSRFRVKTLSSLLTLLNTAPSFEMQSSDI